MVVTWSAALIAGLVTGFSPCVLVMLPVLMGAALQANRLYPLVTVAGLVLSFAVTGIVVERLARAGGLMPDDLRPVGAGILIAFGGILLVPRLAAGFEARTSRALGPLLTRMDGMMGRRGGLVGAALMGLTLGLVWAPCAGPTMISILALAAQSESLTRAFGLMLVYGSGTAVPMLAIAYGGRGLAARLRGLGAHSGKLKAAMGVLLIGLGLAIATSADRWLESVLLTSFETYAVWVGGA